MSIYSIHLLTLIYALLRNTQPFPGYVDSIGEGALAIALGLAALVAASGLMINHGLWSDADAAPRPIAAYSISQSKPKLLLPEFDILQMVAGPWLITELVAGEHKS